jgi:hypothetical protein
MDEEEDFLAAVEADNAIPGKEAPKDEATTATPEAPAEQKDERQRDEHGRFALKAEPEPTATHAPTSEPQPAAQPEAAPAPAPEPQHAPLTALLDERDKRQAAERERDALRAQVQSQQPVEMPDPDLDPAGFAQFQESRLQQVLLNQTLNTSERFARKEHGAETVESAKQWALQKFGSDPHYQAQILADADPYERLVTDWKRDQLFSKVTDPSDFDAFLAWKAAQGQLQQQQAAPAAPATPAPAIPPPSLASAPSAGGVLTEVAQTDKEIFEEVLPKG